jgi:hypothetical protein
VERFSKFVRWDPNLSYRLVEDVVKRYEGRLERTADVGLFEFLVVLEIGTNNLLILGLLECLDQDLSYAE